MRFRAFRRFNDPGLAHLAGLRTRLDQRSLAQLAPPRPTPTVMDRLVTQLAQRQALPVKELFESFEFFERVRRRVRAPTIVDLCAGHGLTGLLFVIFCREVQQVVLVDRRRPVCHDRVYSAAVAAAPWIEGRVCYLEKTLSKARPELSQACAMVAVHACGRRTDNCIDLAIALGGTIAAMPCCYFGTANDAPPGLTAAIGRELSTDIDRTYRLHRAGFDVQWSAIPHAITAKNRILIARPAGCGQPRFTKGT